MSTDTRTTHTPGPWTVEGWDYIPAHRKQVLTIVARGVQTAVGECYPLWRDGADDSQERAANARLIAAAPDLLEAARAVLRECALVHKHWGEGSNRGEAVAAESDLRAAIAKAEGGQGQGSGTLPEGIGGEVSPCLACGEPKPDGVPCPEGDCPTN